MLSTSKLFLLMLLGLKRTIEGKIESMFTSISEMECLIETEENLIKDLEEYINVEKDRLDLVERYLNRSKTEYMKASQHVSEYLANPLNVFKLIKRLSIEFTNIETFILKKNGFTRNMLMKYPSLDALAGAARGLVRLQVTYDLNITQLANGVLFYNSSRNGDPLLEFTSPMTASECYELGLVPAEEQGYMRKIFWMFEALRKRTAENCTYCFVKELAIVDHISNGYYHMGDFKNTIKWIKFRMVLRPKSEETLRQVKFMKKLEKKSEKHNVANPVNITQQNSTYQELQYSCHRKINVRRVIRKMLSCGYVYGHHPYLRLARVKVEMLHLAPDIILIHEAITDTEIRILQHLARPKFWRDRPSGYDSLVGSRHASAAFMDERVEYVFQVTRRISTVTGLNLRRSAPLKVVNFGVGGHSMKSYDYHSNNTVLPPHTLIKGDRIATVMFFMSDVEGGATVFRNLGLKVQPVKGAALYWYNLLPCGAGNYDMIREDCPVLRGSKWIAIKWAQQEDQKFCPIWITSKGLMTEELYSKLNTSEYFLAGRIKKKIAPDSRSNSVRAAMNVKEM